jgi:hypothetical protein
MISFDKFITSFMNWNHQCQYGLWHLKWYIILSQKKGYIEAETEDVVTVEHLHSSSDMENDGRVIIVCP